MERFKMQNSKDLAVVILAAGISSRLGDITKQLLVYKNETLLKIAVKKALEISKDVFVVLGHEREKCKKELEGFDVNIIYNDGKLEYDTFSYMIEDMDFKKNLSENQEKLKQEYISIGLKPFDKFKIDLESK